MRPSGTPDCFSVVNGPEDGAEFAILRTPFTMGSGMSCAVNPRLDQTIHEEQARVTVVSGGYRVRSIRGLPVFVNSKRVGSVWSRIIRSGDVVKLGHTMLALDCAPDGLASRSLGIDVENDLVWAVHHGLQALWRFIKYILYLLKRMVRSIISFWKSTGILGIAFVGFYIFYYPFRAMVNRFFLNIYYRTPLWHIGDFISRFLP